MHASEDLTYQSSIAYEANLRYTMNVSLNSASARQRKHTTSQLVPIELLLVDSSSSVYWLQLNDFPR